eukprot:scaffold30081_cov242-Isochrysis_galbana.AAC.1
MEKTADATYGGGPRHGRDGRSGLVRAGPLISCPWSGSHCDPTEIGVWRFLALLWAVRVGMRALWVR